MKNRSVFGWLELAIGILLIGLGVYSFFEPMDILMSLVFLYGLAALATGIGDIVFYCRMDRHLGFGPTLSLVSGILSVMTGFVLAIHPSAGSWAVVLLFPLWFIAHCISRLARLPLARFIAGRGYYVFSLIVNILGLLLGFAMLFSPQLSLTSLNIVMAVYLLLLGIDCLTEAFTNIGAQR